MKFKLESPYHIHTEIYSNSPVCKVLDILDFCIDYFFHNLVNFAFHIFGK